LRQLSAVSSLPDFQRVMILAAQRTGKLLNQADLARDPALSHPTTHRYLNLLETGFLVRRIRPMATNPSAAIVKAPKLFWTDCGLGAWLAGIKSSADATQRLDAGFWLEQTLFQTLDTGVPSIHNGASWIFGGIVRGTKWISFWKRPASW
jgi:predicted AAA+ superfamily ATPase